MGKSLREKIGQLVMMGFSGTEVSPDCQEWIHEFQPGGVILFSRNLQSPSQVAALTNTLQSLSPSSPLLIAIDQEGGRVSRLPKGFTIFPPAATVSSCHSLQLAYDAAAVTAKELRAVGVNMNMAPVLDVNTNPANPIIGNRAFGKTPDQVGEYGVATMSGLQDHGVVACGKHFPGHGETSADSHLELPVVTLGKERIEEIELPPFRHAIERGLASIMTAHVHYPALDKESPATLSYPILTDLLRNTLGFDGVVLTDDMEMQAILDHSSVGAASVRALQAGADILLICHQQDRQTEAIYAVEQAIESGQLSMDRLDQTVQRVQQLKAQYVPSSQPSSPEHLQEVVGCSAHQQVLNTILETTNVS
ncbi:MAG: beta-N-acetylhexosaminidase [Nitrospirae bacterium]|nr:beta-N-acetylhexosaminidase [Nitrospirota bacterium]